MFAILAMAMLMVLIAGLMFATCGLFGWWKRIASRVPADVAAKSWWKPLSAVAFTLPLVLLYIEARVMWSILKVPLSQFQ